VVRRWWGRGGGVVRRWWGRGELERGGGVEGWKGGRVRVEGWRGGGVEGWKGGRLRVEG